ncbi:MAG TPA: cytochrome P450 [Azospirillaceae bacterium]|nr:cytochrome P450 [Azospirillaceae bacterium]
MTALDAVLSLPPVRRGELGIPRIAGVAALEMLRMGADPLGYITRAARLGNVVELPMLGERVLLLSHPDHVRYVLTDPVFGKSTFYEKVRPLLGYGLVTSEGELWKRQRRLMQPAFHKDAIEGMVAIMVRRTRGLMDEWSAAAASGEPLDAFRHLMRLTQRIVVEALFGDDIGADEDRVTEAANTILAHAERRIWRPLDPPNWVPTPENRRTARSIADLDRIVNGIVDRRREGRPRQDLLQMLLDARDEDGQPMPAHQVRDEVLTLLISGHETTGTSLAWALLALALHPAYRRRARSEAATWPDAPLANSVRQQPFIRAVIDESLRWMPPAWTISRVALEDTEIGGHAIPAGTSLMCAPYLVHRNPDWWPDPEAFDPNRWTGESPQAARRAYVAFGAGARVCIGQAFSMTEMTVVLAEILRRFDFSLLSGADVRPRPMIMLKPSPGVPLVLRECKAPAAAS